MGEITSPIRAAHNIWEALGLSTFDQHTDSAQYCIIYAGARWCIKCIELETHFSTVTTSTCPRLFISCDVDNEATDLHSNSLQENGGWLRFNAVSSVSRADALRTLGVSSIPFLSIVSKYEGIIDLSRSGISTSSDISLPDDLKKSVTFYHSLYNQSSMVPAADSVFNSDSEHNSTDHLTQAMESYENGDSEGALGSFSMALAKNPHAGAYYNSAVILHYLDPPLTLLAVDYLAKVIELTPGDATAHSVLGTVFFATEPQAVIDGYRQVVARFPGPKHARSAHQLAALAGEGSATLTASHAYVAEVFDTLANTFETTLVDHLNYRVPWQLYDAVQKLHPLAAKGSEEESSSKESSAKENSSKESSKDPDSDKFTTSTLEYSAERFSENSAEHSSDKFTASTLEAVSEYDWKILDLGCGTGLCGRIFERYTAKEGGCCIGVDLSPKMIDIARERGGYHQLEVADIHDALQNTAPGTLNLILSADTFIYVGQLERCFSLAVRALCTGGLLGFSIEELSSSEECSSSSQNNAVPENGAADVSSSQNFLDELSSENILEESSSANRSAGFKLVNTGRYAHTQTYIENLAIRESFHVVTKEHITVRNESGKPIAGLIYVLRKET